ncbi:hypothetical protein NUM3379_10670 [Kineococcus sp. NUM-3379]
MRLRGTAGGGPGGLTRASPPVSGFRRTADGGFPPISGFRRTAGGGFPPISGFRRTTDGGFPPISGFRRTAGRMARRNPEMGGLGQADHLRRNGSDLDEA